MYIQTKTVLDSKIAAEDGQTNNHYNNTKTYGSFSFYIFIYNNAK